jgi:dTDP-4-dehydrorhamnose 3,5-epimerase
LQFRFLAFVTDCPHCAEEVKKGTDGALKKIDALLAKTKMKILEIRSLAIPDVKVVRYARFRDDRGYFTETFRKSDLLNHADAAACFRGVEFKQTNESHSQAGVVRGMHFQWNPNQGKLVRTIVGRIIDLALDIRKGSPTFGKIIAYDLPASADAAFGEWIWLPPGFAHTACIVEKSTIEYFCSAEWAPGNETGISPLAADLDWSLCDPALKAEYEQTLAAAVLSPKDREGFSLGAWSADPRSEFFCY